MAEIKSIDFQALIRSAGGRAADAPQSDFEFQLDQVDAAEPRSWRELAAELEGDDEMSETREMLLYIAGQLERGEVWAFRLTGARR